MAPGLQDLEIIPFRVAAYDTKVSFEYNRYHTYRYLLIIYHSCSLADEETED